MPDKVEVTPHLKETADRIILDALELFRMLTPEAWEMLYVNAVMDRNVHTSDARMIDAARLMALRGGTRYKPDPSYTNPELAEQLQRNRR